MERDVIKAIETTDPTTNEGKEEVIFPVEFDDTGGGGDKGPVIIQSQTYQYWY